LEPKGLTKQTTNEDGSKHSGAQIVMTSMAGHIWKFGRKIEIEYIIFVSENSP